MVKIRDTPKKTAKNHQNGDKIRHFLSKKRSRKQIRLFSLFYTNEIKSIFSSSVSKPSNLRSAIPSAPFSVSDRREKRSSPSEPFSFGYLEYPTFAFSFHLTQSGSLSYASGFSTDSPFTIFSAKALNSVKSLGWFRIFSAYILAFSQFFRTR